MPPPTAGPGQVVVDVERVGRLRHRRRVLHRRDGLPAPGARGVPDPARARVVRRRSRRSATASTAAWLGRRVTGDTMLGCGRCRRCRAGRQHVCADRHEIGIRGGWPGALAEQLRGAGDALHALPDAVGRDRSARWSSRAATRCARSGPPGSAPGDRVLVARARARSGCWRPCSRGPPAPRCTCSATGRRRWSSPARSASTGAWTAADAAGAAVRRGRRRLQRRRAARPHALDLVEPGGRVVYIGLAGRPSLIDTRDLVLKDVTAVGILSASPALRGGSSCTPPAPSTRVRWSPPPSGWTRSPTCWPATGRPAPAPARRSTSTPAA